MLFRSSFAGGFTVQSLMALWLFERFDLSLSAASLFFFWTSVLSAFSMNSAKPSPASSPSLGRSRRTSLGSGVLATRVWLPIRAAARPAAPSQRLELPSHGATVAGCQRVRSGRMAVGVGPAVVMDDTVQPAKARRISLTRLDLSTVGRMTCRRDMTRASLQRSLGRLIGRGWVATLTAAGIAGVGLFSTGFIAAQPALAIPEADAIKKLDVIPVFVLTDDKGVPLPIPREKNLVLPLYLESAKANQQLAELRRVTRRHFEKDHRIVFREVMRTKAFQERLAKLDQVPGYLAGDELLAEQHKSREFWRKLARQRGIEM